VKATDKPKQVTLWQATNPAARDFRVETLGKKYTATILKPDEQGDYVGNVSKPAKGWTAYFVELTYDTGTKLPYKVSTAVRVVPDVLPHADKDPSAPVDQTAAPRGKRPRSRRN
jgi:PhoPQ-activated pathogenicity-related protein